MSGRWRSSSTRCSPQSPPSTARASRSLHRNPQWHLSEDLDLSRRRPEALEDAIDEALTVDRDDRISSVEALAARLAPFGTTEGQASYARIQRAVAGKPADPPTPSTGTEPFVGTKEGATTTGAVLAPLVQSQPKVATPARGWKPTAALGLAAMAAAAGLTIVSFRATHRSGVAASPSAAAGPAIPSAAAAAHAAPCAAGATADCEAACAAQEADSCHQLARALENGVGAARNVERAATLYKDDCDGVSLASCNSLGALYGRGEGVPHDDRQAVALFDDACKQGYPLACVNLGAMLLDGTGVQKDEQLAAKKFFRGCEANEPRGCLYVSIVYETGRGVAKNPGESFAYAQRARTGGLVDGCIAVAMKKIEGDGIAKDVKAGSPTSMLSARTVQHRRVKSGWASLQRGLVARPRPTLCANA
jgi:TPR repeat protein